MTDLGPEFSPRAINSRRSTAGARLWVRIKRATSLSGTGAGSLSYPALVVRLALPSRSATEAR